MNIPVVTQLDSDIKLIDVLQQMGCTSTGLTEDDVYYWLNQSFVIRDGKIYMQPFNAIPRHVLHHALKSL